MGKRPKPTPPPGAYMPSSDLRGSGPSDPSRDSVSEASKAIEGRRTGEDLAKWRQRRYGKEGRGDVPRYVRVQSTTSRQSEALESTAPSVLPTQRTTSRHDTQHNLPRPTTSFLTPGHSSYNKPPGRLTLPPSRNTDSNFETTRFIAPTPVRQDVTSLPKTAPSKSSSAKPYIPRQKITPLVTDSSTSRGSQSDKNKSTFGAHNGLSPNKKLIVAEEGHWQDGAWVEGEAKTARQQVDNQPLFSASSPDITNAVLDSAVPEPIVHQANPHDDDLPSSPPPSPTRPSAARRLRLPHTPPTNAQLAQALPAGHSQVDHSPIFSQPASSKEDAWWPQPLDDRPKTRRERMVSTRTEDEGMLAVATSSTRIDRSSSRPRGRRVSTSPLTDDDAHTHPALRKESILPKPLSHPKPTSAKSRSASSALKQPLTYGASKTNMIPAPLGAKKSRQMDAREERKAARRAKGDHLQQLDGTDRRDNFSRYGDNVPMSNARDSSYSQVRKSRTRTDVELPLSTSGVLASSRASSARSIKPAYVLPVDDAPGAGEGADNFQDDDGEKRMGVDEESGPPQSNFERDNAFRAGVTLHETDIETSVDRPRRTPAKEKVWVRPKTKKSKSKKRRRGSPSYRYLDGGRPPTSQPICNPAVYRKRPRTFHNGLDDSDADERGERRRKRQRRHQWGDPHPEEASGTDEEKVDPRYQPLSKYGDPIERDREYQLETHGLYVLGQGLEGMAAKALHDWERARERVDRAPPPPKLKMSRKRSANERVIKFVNVISDHSKSSRTIRPIPVRNATAKIRDLPGYVIKPLKTISWEEYNTAYNEERPFAINNQLVQRTMSGLRAKALKPGGGRNRLRTTRTGIRQDREIRRLESRAEEVDDINERIDTLTPSLRPPVESVSRMGVRRVPKLVFTTRTPPPLPSTLVKSQKRKVTGLLMSAEKEVGDGDGIVMEEEWGGDVQHDPIIPDFFDDAFQVDPISVQDPILAPRDQQPNENVHSRVGGKTIYMSSTTGKLKPVTAATQVTAESSNTGAFSHDNIGETEWGKINPRVPNLGQEGRTVTTAGKSVLASRHPVPADDIFDDDDFPSVPSAVNRPSGSTSRYKPPGPTVASSDTTSTGGMLSGVNMTDLMMEALKKTAALFDTPPAKLPPPPTGGMIGGGPGRLRRVRQQKTDEATKGKAISKPKGKGRDPGERPNDPSSHESQLTLPRMLQHRPRATQLPSRTGEDMDEVPLPPASARVVVAPPVFAAVPPLPGMMGAGTAPRLGLQRTRTAGLMTPLRTSSPLLAGKSMNMLKSQFKPPTQGTPTQLSRSRPRAPLSQINPRHYASSELDQDDSSTTPYNEPGQHCPSPTQTTVAGGRTPGQSRNRYVSTTRVSTTQRDSSAADLSDMTPGQQYDDEPDAYHPYAQKRPSLYDYQDPQYSTRPDPLSGRNRAIDPSRQIGPSSSISSGFAPVNPAALIRRTSFSKVMPKHSALKRNTKADYLPGGDGMGIGAPAQPGRSARGVAQRRAREDRRGVGNEGNTSGLRMERIGSQRARQQFRAPTRRPIGGEEGEQGEGERR